MHWVVTGSISAALQQSSFLLSNLAQHYTGASMQMFDLLSVALCCTTCPPARGRAGQTIQVAEWCHNVCLVCDSAGALPETSERVAVPGSKLQPVHLGLCMWGPYAPWVH